MGSREKKKANLLPYATIQAASMGSEEAIQTVLTHYADYIDALSKQIVFDENGIARDCVDEEIKRQLKEKLTIKILRFQADRVK